MSGKNNISPLNTGNGGKGRLSEDKLMAYIDGKLSADEQHDIEQWLSEEGMESDALEGLRMLKPGAAHDTVNKLKHELRKTLVNKKHKRRPLRAEYHTWMAIAIILLLAIVAYIVVRFALHK